MSGKTRNPSKSCKACGAPVKANVRYCVACAIQRKAARVGIDPRKVHVGVFYARPSMLDAALAGEHSTGGYLCEIAREMEGITPERMTV
jgi:hypothetical protein